MLKKIIFSFLFLTVLIPVVSSATTVKLEFAAWVPYWKKTAAAPETTAHLSQLKTISPFSFEVNANGTLKDAMKISQDPWPTMLTAAKSAKTKIVPSILWNDSNSIHNILSNKSRRDQHINNIVSQIIAGGYDGIDIDYENKKTETINYFSTFIRDLSKKLHVQKKSLSCTIEPRTPPTSRFLQLPEEIKYANNYLVLNQYCDEVRIMTYDQTTVDVKLTKQNIQKGYYTPVADPAWVKKVIVYASNDISRKKIVLGVANYGYEYRVVDKNKYYDYTKLRSLTYKGAMDLAVSVGATPKRNVAGELSFTYQKDGETRLVWFSDAQAIADKVKLAKQYGLKGVALFKVDGESDPNLWITLK